jgi:hypothetical protein
MIRLAATVLLGCLLTLTSGGCAVLGYVAATVPGAGSKARYAGLAGQKVAVMTWVERAVTYDYGALPADVSMGVQNKLVQAANPKLKMEELKGTTFIDPRQVFKWQKNHPELENRSLEEVAPKLAAALGCTRLIYLEVSPFSVFDPRTPVLLKGSATITIRVAEVGNGGSVKTGYAEAGVLAEFPEKAPEGVPPTDTMTPTYVYQGLVDKITTEVAKRFFSSEAGEE